MKETRIEIWCEFGSDFQEQVYGESLDTMIRAWVQAMTAAHKKNKAVVEISQHPIRPKPYPAPPPSVKQRKYE